MLIFVSSPWKDEGQWAVDIFGDLTHAWDALSECVDEDAEPEEHID